MDLFATLHALQHSLLAVEAKVDTAKGTASTVDNKDQGALGGTVNQKIRVTTKRDLFESSKREHLEAGYEIEDEQPVPVNGLCSFTAVRRAVNDNPFESELS